MRQRLVGLVILVLVLVTGFWAAASAQNFRSGSNATVGPNETIDSSLWIAGRTIDIAGQIHGDLFCAGQNVTISGTVQGDVLCAAQTIVISGTVAGDVRSMSQTLTLSGTVANNLSSLAQSVSEESRASVRGDASVGANDITLNGFVGRDAALGAAEIVVNGPVGRDVQASVNNLRLGSKARIAGSLNYSSAKNVQIDQGAVVEGTTTKTAPKGKKQAPSSAAFGLGFALYLLGAALLAGLILALLFPQAFHAAAAVALASPWKTLLVGFVACLIVPALVIFSMLTVIGIPFGLLLLVAWILIQALAGFAAAYFTGRLIWRRQRNPIILMLLGITILFVLYLIPFINLLVILAATFMGVGMLLLALNRRRPKPRYSLE